MFLIKCIIYCLIFTICTYIGILIANKYANRVKELQELKLSLNMLKTKIRYTSDTLPSIFKEISETYKGNISNLFKEIYINLNTYNTETAWKKAIDNTNTSLKKEDRQAIKPMGKLLGKTDLDGQISEIELTESFIETKISDALKEKEKNEKLYKTLGIVTGLGIIIILF